MSTLGQAHRSASENNVPLLSSLLDIWGTLGRPVRPPSQGGLIDARDFDILNLRDTIIDYFTASDVPRLAPHVRPEDRDELARLHRAGYAHTDSLHDELLRGIDEGDAFIAFDRSGKEFAAFGVTHAANVWFVCTPDIKKHKRDLLILGRYFIGLVQDRVGIPWNFISPHNDFGVRLVKHLGGAVWTTDCFNGMSLFMIPSDSPVSTEEP